MQNTDRVKEEARRQLTTGWMWQATTGLMSIACTAYGYRLKIEQHDVLAIMFWLMAAVFVVILVQITSCICNLRQALKELEESEKLLEEARALEELQQSIESRVPENIHVFKAPK